MNKNVPIRTEVEIYDSICSVDSCNNQVKTMTYCYKHYARLKRHGDPLKVLRVRVSKRPKICSIDDCGGQHEAYGYCNKHYTQKVRNNTLECINRKICSKKNCGKYSVALGYCSPHYNEITSMRYRLIVFNHYKQKIISCVCCKETDLDMLEMDHINGGGTKHRKEIGTRLSIWLIKNNFPSGFQILCANCNKSKYRNNGICSHKLTGKLK